MCTQTSGTGHSKAAQGGSRGWPAYWDKVKNMTSGEAGGPVAAGVSSWFFMEPQEMELTEFMKSGEDKLAYGL